MKSIKIALAFVAIISFLSVQITNAQTVSDKDLKKKQAPITNSLSYINQLEPLTFEFDKDSYKQLNLPGGKQYGFIADDVQRILPNLVTKNYKWYTAGKNNQRTVTTTAVNYEQLIPLLVSAIKEQQAEINELRAHLQQMKSK